MTVDDLETRRRPPLSVFEQFRAFWREVDALRTMALSPSMAPPASPGTMVLVHAPTAVRDRLLAALRSQDAELSRSINGKALGYYREAQYAMVAVADEVFVRLAWNGATYWASNLLETERFATRRAGQAVFERIDGLLERADPDDKELAAVYLTALALGFQGKYADRFDGAPSTATAARSTTSSSRSTRTSRTRFAGSFHSATKAPSRPEQARSSAAPGCGGGRPPG